MKHLIPPRFGTGQRESRSCPYRGKPFPCRLFSGPAPRESVKASKFIFRGLIACGEGSGLERSAPFTGSSAQFRQSGHKISPAASGLWPRAVLRPSGLGWRFRFGVFAGFRYFNLYRKVMMPTTVS